MASKRTFGLVGDYGDDSSDDNEENSTNDTDERSDKCMGYFVEKKSKVEEDVNNGGTITSQQYSKWNGVRTEYEDSSLMYKYTQVFIQRIF